MKKKTIPLVFFIMLSIAAFSQDSVVGVLSSQGGRYVFGQISRMREDQFMLDTQTGQLWQMMLVGTNKAIRLCPVYYDVWGEDYVKSPSEIQTAQKNILNKQLLPEDQLPLAPFSSKKTSP